MPYFIALFSIFPLIAAYILKNRLKYNLTIIAVLNIIAALLAWLNTRTPAHDCDTGTTLGCKSSGELFVVVTIANFIVIALIWKYAFDKSKLHSPSPFARNILVGSGWFLITATIILVIVVIALFINALTVA
jgi:heme/copper-type cytochrome/quinol oxidase subunit 2